MIKIRPDKNVVVGGSDLTFAKNRRGSQFVRKSSGFPLKLTIFHLGFQKKKSSSHPFSSIFLARIIYNLGFQ